MKSKIIFIIFIFTIISSKVIIDEPELIPKCLNPFTIIKLSNKYKNYISDIFFDYTILLTYDINKAKKYCDNNYCIGSFDSAEYVDSSSEFNHKINIDKKVNGSYFNLFTEIIHEKKIAICFFEVKFNGKVIQQYDITKKLVCNRMNGNKCKIIYGKSARQLLESEKNFISESIHNYININIKKTLENYIK